MAQASLDINSHFAQHLATVVDPFGVHGDYSTNHNNETIKSTEEEKMKTEENEFTTDKDVIMGTTTTYYENGEGTVTSDITTITDNQNGETSIVTNAISTTTSTETPYLEDVLDDNKVVITATSEEFTSTNNVSTSAIDSSTQSLSLSTSVNLINENKSTSPSPEWTLVDNKGVAEDELSTDLSSPPTET